MPEELARLIWDVAFPGEEYDGSSLPDVYEAGIRQAHNATLDLLRKHLTVDKKGLDESYRLWLSLPWYRIYTLNIDTLFDVAARAFDLPRAIHLVSALTEPVPPSETASLDVIHLNGRMEDLPEVTFSGRQYGERLARPDLWYENLVREIQSHPVLFVGSSLDEPPLWMYVEARGRRGEQELRPGSYLVAPGIGKARRVALAAYNVAWIDSSAEDFAATVLSQLESDASEGRKAIVQRVEAEAAAEAILNVGDIRSDSRDDEREFLNGREPRWSDITPDGYAFEREFDAELASAIREDAPRLITITGTAGAGKSTVSMRLALAMLAVGKRTYVFNQASFASLRDIRNAVHSTGVEVLLIDNADRFAETAMSLIQDLLDENPDMQIIACIRSARLEQIGTLVPEGVAAIERAVPHLGETDVESLLDTLDRANRLGVLKGMTRKQQCEAVEKRFNRQLLVAMIEITQNVRFDEKVESECRDLEGAAAFLYAVAAIATHLRATLTDQEMVIASGSAPPQEAMHAKDRLLARHLLSRGRDDRISVRHTVIAGRAVRYYRDLGLLPKVVTALAFALASSTPSLELRASRAGRLLVRLIQHDRLISLLYRGQDPAVNHASVREVYDGLEGLLQGDYHYWLQRGSFETEEGDLQQAKSFLDQARSMAPNDALVRTEWSYMALKRASRNPADQNCTQDVDVAFGELEEVINVRGETDPYPYHVYGIQGLAWARNAPIGEEQKKALLEQLRRVVGEGARLHPTESRLQELKSRVDRAYLMLAVPPDQREEGEQSAS